MCESGGLQELTEFDVTVNGLKWFVKMPSVYLSPPADRFLADVSAQGALLARDLEDRGLAWWTGRPRTSNKIIDFAASREVDAMSPPIPVMKACWLTKESMRAIGNNCSRITVTQHHLADGVRQPHVCSPYSSLRDLFRSNFSQEVTELCLPIHPCFFAQTVYGSSHM